MKNNYLYLVPLFVYICSFVGVASEASDNQTGQGKSISVSVVGAYIRSSIPGTTITSSYMIIENKGEKTVTLLGASSKISPRIEIHQHTMADGMMRMRQVNSIDIIAKQRIVLQPSGLHLMLFDIKKPLQAQQKVELTLNFSNKPPVIIQVPVYSPKQERRAQKAGAHFTIEHTHHH